LQAQAHRANLPSSGFEGRQQSLELLDVHAEVVHSAKRFGDRAEGGMRVIVEFCEPPLEPVKLRAQDERARSTFFQQAPKLRLGHGRRRFSEHLPQSPPQNGVELKPRLGHGLGG
jgi:hypothetical protein